MTAATDKCERERDARTRRAGTQLTALRAAKTERKRERECEECERQREIKEAQLKNFYCLPSERQKR